MLTLILILMLAPVLRKDKEDVSFHWSLLWDVYMYLPTDYFMNQCEELHRMISTPCKKARAEIVVEIKKYMNNLFYKKIYISCWRLLIYLQKSFKFRKKKYWQVWVSLNVFLSRYIYFLNVIALTYLFKINK